MKRTATIFFVLFAAGVILSGCRFDLASSSSWMPGHIVSSYAYKDGPESTGFNAKAGQVCTIEYSTTVSSGELEILINDPNGKEIWSESFTRDGSGKAEILLPEEGQYHLTVMSQKTSGGFQVDWSVE